MYLPWDFRQEKTRNSHLGCLLIKSPTVPLEFGLLLSCIVVILGRKVQDLLNLVFLFQYTSYWILWTGDCLSSVPAKSVPCAFDIELFLVGCRMSLAVTIIQQLLLVSLHILRTIQILVYAKRIIKTWTVSLGPCFRKHWWWNYSWIIAAS